MFNACISIYWCDLLTFFSNLCQLPSFLHRTDSSPSNLIFSHHHYLEYFPLYSTMSQNNGRISDRLSNMKFMQGKPTSNSKSAKNNQKQPDTPQEQPEIAPTKPKKRRFIDLSDSSSILPNSTQAQQFSHQVLTNDDKAKAEEDEQTKLADLHRAQLGRRGFGGFNKHLETTKTELENQIASAKAEKDGPQIDDIVSFAKRMKTNASAVSQRYEADLATQTTQETLKKQHKGQVNKKDKSGPNSNKKHDQHPKNKK